MANGAASYGEIYAIFENERPLYQRLVDDTVDRLARELKVSGIAGEVKGRVKESASFATKALLKGYDDPLEQIGDKAGVRITLTYEDDVPPTTELVRRCLHVRTCESKLDALAYNEFGYLGVHCDSRLNDADAVGERADFAGLRVEVQIRTMAQSAWAEVSHAQLYKPPADVPDELKRQVHRLVGLIELFDSEVSRFVRAASETPGYKEAEALTPLAGELLQRFDVRAEPDRQLSLRMAAAIVPLYGMEPGTVFAERLSPWIDENEDALRVQFEEAQALRTNPLFLQPEAFLIFERLMNDQARLRDGWPDDVPLAWYDEIAAAWGVGN